MNGTNWWTTDPSMRWEYNEREIETERYGVHVKFKKLHPDAVVPSYAKEGDAGLDLTAYRMTPTKAGIPYIEYGTGIAMEIPQGYVGLVFPRSSISKLEGFSLKNSVGVIDSGYRGEIMLRFSKSHEHYNIGDKVGQLIILPYPQIHLEEVEELSSTDRGVGGFGSTGK